MKTILILMILGLAVSCSTKTSEKNVKTLALADSINITKQTSNPTLNQPSVSMMDTSETSKSEIRPRYYNGKVIKKERYLNSKLHGESVEYLANNDIHLTRYSAGKREGYSMLYSPNQSTAQFVTYWRNNQQVWSAFPSMIEADLIPIKGFNNSSGEEIEIVVPFVSGKTLLKGKIDQDGKPSGKHRIYFETQELRAIVDYENDSIQFFSKLGILVKSIQRHTNSLERD